MNQQQKKSLIPEFVIIAVVLYGLWAMAISPMREDLSQARAAHAEVIEIARIAGDPLLSTPRLEKVKNAIDTTIEEIERRSEIARDQTTLQARLMEISDQSRVRIDRVNPAKTSAVISGNADDSVVSFELECSGSYRDITRFIAEIEENIGLTRIDRISVRPDHTTAGSAVRASLRTMHYAFSMMPPPTDATAGLPGGSN